MSAPQTLGTLLDADWARLLEFSGLPPSPRRLSNHFSPRFASVVLVRVAHRLHVRGWRRCARFYAMVNFVLFGIEVPAALAIGPGLVLPHTQGTIIGAGHIGANVTIYAQVVLGAKVADFDFDPAKRPHIEDGVLITAGAKVLGPVRVGANAVIGANAVVLNDVPAGAIAVGVPARILQKAAE
jgi:serine O-acetyltransferase